MPKISALTSLAQASVDTAADVLPIVDATAPATTKKVTVQAMVNAGLAAAAPQGGIFALTGALTVSGTSTMGVTRASAADGTITFGVQGATRGVRILTSSYGTAIEGVDNTLVGSYQPLNVIATTLGLYTTGGGNVQIGTGSNLTQFSVTHTASAVNFIQATGAATGAAPSLAVGGSDANVWFNYYTKGSGLHQFITGGGVQFAVGHVANAVNRVTAYGNATGLTPGLFAEGSDANVGLGLYSKAAGPVFTAVRGAVSAYFDNPASPVNYATITGSATGLSVVYGAGGSDTNVPVVVTSKGAGSVGLYSNSGANAILFAAHVASSVNYWTISGAATGGLNTLTTQGADTNIGAYLATKGSGAWRFATGGGDQFRIINVASAVNYWSVFGNVTAGAPTLYADGSDSLVNASYSLKGGGSHIFYTGSTSAVQFVIAHVASTVNWPVISGSATGNAVTISTGGSDANISFNHATKGIGVHSFLTNGSVEQFRVAHVASAVNYLQAQGAATGASPILFATGSDPNVNLIYSLKGAGAHAFYTNSTTAPQFFIAHTASATNYVQATGAATGNAVTISASGSDSNIDFAIAPKGTGVLRFGTHSALAAETVTGYITIKDSAGNTRKLAVVS